MPTASGRPRQRYKCPHCGQIDWRLKRGLIRAHAFDGKPCPGTGQVPRNPLSDMRPLWKDEAVQS